MPNKTEYMNIVCMSRSYLAPLKMMGPIVHPLKVAKSAVVKLLIAGAEVYEFDPVTKNSAKLTLSNINEKDRFGKVSKKDTAVKAEPLKGVTVIKKENIIEETPVVAPVMESVPTSTEETSEKSVVETEANTLPELVIDEATGKVDESKIDWSSYTKAERKLIRNKINEMNHSDE